MMPARLLRIFSLLLGIAILGSCSKYSYVDCETYDYSDCDTWQFETGTLEVQVSFPNGQKKVPVVIFMGNYPSTDTVMVDTLTSGSMSYTLDIGHTYSMSAEYTVNGQKILAVDGDEVTQKSYDVCDSVCWLVRDGQVDLRLKFDE